VTQEVTLKKNIDLGITLSYLRDYLADYCAEPGQELPLDLVGEMINDDYIFLEIAGAGFDTVAREKCMDWLSKKVTGMRWPTYVSSQDYKEKHDRLWKEGLENYARQTAHSTSLLDAGQGLS